MGFLFLDLKSWTRWNSFKQVYKNYERTFVMNSDLFLYFNLESHLRTYIHARNYRISPALTQGTNAKGSKLFDNVGLSHWRDCKDTLILPLTNCFVEMFKSSDKLSLFFSVSIFAFVWLWSFLSRFLFPSCKISFPLEFTSRITRMVS